VAKHMELLGPLEFLHRLTDWIWNNLRIRFGEIGNRNGHYRQL